MSAVKASLTTTAITVDRKFFAAIGITDDALFPERESVEGVLSLRGVDNSVSNAIARVMSIELPVKALWCEFSGYKMVESKDDFHIPEMILARLTMIPLDQNCPLDATFELIINNPHPEMIYVFTGDIKRIGKGGPLPFDKNIQLMTLAAGRSCMIKDIKVTESAGNIRGMGKFSVANGVASIVDEDGMTPQDAPYQQYEGIGTPTTLQNYSAWKVRFTTNGTIEPKNLCITSCKNIIARITTVATYISMVKSIGDVHILDIAEETSTIGNLIMRSALRLYPDISVVFKDENFSLTITIISHDDIKSIYKNIIADVVGIFEVEHAIGKVLSNGFGRAPLLVERVVVRVAEGRHHPIHWPAKSTTESRWAGRRRCNRPFTT